MMTEEIQIAIERQAYGGYGIGFTGGKAVFVRGAATGDLCAIRINSDTARYSTAELIRVIKPSADRIDAPCPNFPECGGCSYGQVSYDAELRYKLEILQYNMASIGGFKPEDVPRVEVIESPSRFNYRSHASVKSDGISAGFFTVESNRLVPFPEQGCLLLHEGLISAIKEMPRYPVGGFKIALGNGSYPVWEQGSTVTDEVNGLSYTRRIENFFQSNTYLRGRMLDKVDEFASPWKNGKKGFLDIGCGVGFFTVYLSRAGYGKGFGADIDGSSINSARLNAERNAAAQIEFFTSSDGDIDIHRIKAGLVVIDPPRAGITKRGKKTIAALAPDAVVYVSCNPATFARDAKDMVKNGFRLKRLSMIDMFPMTRHIEVISLFVKPEGN